MTDMKQVAERLRKVRAANEVSNEAHTKAHQEAYGKGDDFGAMLHDESEAVFRAKSPPTNPSPRFRHRRRSLGRKALRLAFAASKPQLRSTAATPNQKKSNSPKRKRPSPQNQPPSLPRPGSKPQTTNSTKSTCSCSKPNGPSTRFLLA